MSDFCANSKICKWLLIPSLATSLASRGNDWQLRSGNPLEKDRRSFRWESMMNGQPTQACRGSCGGHLPSPLLSVCYILGPQGCSTGELVSKERSARVAVHTAFVAKEEKGPRNSEIF
ncbi:hypothetical protein CEXT_354451 [Caerostris extrusa]|uniref:Secreted protein n=1 Tax=Caerostris extrusa TaxID=172846 RepID=A0AAV4XDP7_CAEEX|nr:hypothetical protein CEXT_354451 [Caerostris extrusa]